MADTTGGGETLRTAVDLSLRYYSGLWRLATDYLRAIGSLAVNGGTPAAPQPAPPSAAPMPPLLLAGRAGEDAMASFIVENTLGEQVTARLEVQASGAAARLTAQPEAVVLGPGEQCVIQARVRIEDDMAVGEDCFGALAVPELASRTVPFVIRRLADPAPADKE